MIRLAIAAALLLTVLGTGGYVYHRWTSGQAAIEARTVMCAANREGMKAEGLKCSDENLAKYVKIRDERAEAALRANEQNALAIELQREQLTAQAEAVAAQSARIASSEAKLRALSGRIAQTKAQSEVARRFLAQPVPPEVEALLDDGSGQ